MQLMDTELKAVLRYRAFLTSGLYGHSSVYDADTNSILVFGGYVYGRSLSLPSSTLYSLDLSTLQWSALQLSSEVHVTPPRGLAPTACMYITSL